MTWILMAFLALAPAHAQSDMSATSSQMWVCSVQVTLFGDGHFYLLYGRDSWRGAGPMTCRAGPTTLNLNADVVFNSMAGAVGANGTSSLYMTATFWTMTPPGEFQARRVIDGAPSDPYFRWEFSSELTTVHATVWSPLTPTLRTSLSQGTLFIATAVKALP